jgi:hypothetical protein
MGKGFEDGGETDDWSSRLHGFQREERSRFKGVCYSTSLAGVNAPWGDKQEISRFPFPESHTASL